MNRNLSVFSNAFNTSGQLELSGIGLGPVTSTFINVAGGTFDIFSDSFYKGSSIASFQIGKYEVTWDEWKEVRAWALTNGYSDLANSGTGSEIRHPVQTVSWYDALKWCNAKSQKEGLSPVYKIFGVTYRTGRSKPDVDLQANGYRLPSDSEWEWAARGGIYSLGYIYSGSNDLNLVAWHGSNSGGAFQNPFYAPGDGRGAWPVGTKLANELGIHDMSGNVWEWVFDQTQTDQIVRGGTFISDAIGCKVSYRLYRWIPETMASWIGFRLARNAP